ncbi:MAG: T9SS type A sorting domain-containing protein [Bacteroidetes bacterium]|nr:MAG: T9SS type A sorting domain-containing protein [Bacteroidota bacterium]
MKKIVLSTLVGLVAQFVFAQTAVNFTATDCVGLPHTLFTELDAGKVVVITWVMPCAACIPVASTVATTVQGYSSSYPGRVKFYLVDDYADTQCSSLSGWASANSITPDANFSDAVISMADYGGSGGSMQKTIVLGGDSHAVFYNVNGTVAVSALQTAITNALAATSGIASNNDMSLGLSVFPSPASSNTKINYTIVKATNVNIELMNILGERVNAIFSGVQFPGKQEYQINVESLSEGIYFIKIDAGGLTQTVKLTVIH